MNSTFAFIGRVIGWLDVPAHRRKLYRSATLVIPALVMAGLLTDGRAQLVLGILAALTGASVPHLAAGRTSKSGRNDRGALDVVAGCVIVTLVLVVLLFFGVRLHH